MALITSKVEIEYSGAGAGWTDMTADVLTPLSIAYGIQGSGPTDRVASSGSMTLLLNNSALNAARTQSYYSPGASQARAGWSIGLRVRAQFYDQASATWYVKFIGNIVSITPDAGKYASRRVKVIVTDWMDEAARANVSGLSTQLNKRSDEILTLLINNVTKAPYATSIGTGKDTYAYALDTARDDRSDPVLQEIARVTGSELGYFYVKGTGTVTFEPRFARSILTDAATFNDSMRGLSVEMSRDNILTKVQAVTYPRTVDTSIQVLYTLNTASRIDIGGTLTLVAGYTDPNNRTSRVGGTSMVTPVATTDYLANSAADGSGTNLTAQVTVSATFSGNSAALTITNNASVPAYMTLLRVRGLGIYDYGKTVGQDEDASLASQFGQSSVTLDMPYQNDPAVGLSAARYLLGLYGADQIGIWALNTNSILGTTTQLAYWVQNSIGSVSIAPTTAAIQTETLARDVGDRIKIIETVTGVSKSFYIQAVNLVVQSPGIPFVTWILAPADTQVYWKLGQAGFSDLGATTRLAYT